MSKDLILMIEEFIDNCSSSNLEFLEEVSNFLKENNIVLSEKEIETLILHSKKLNNKLASIIKCNKEVVSRNEIFDITDDYNSRVILETYCNLNELIETNYLEKTTLQRLLTLEEEQKLFERFHNGDNDAKMTLINYNKRLVYFVVNKYTNLGVDTEDLIQDGIEGLLKAIKYYDYKRGFKFSTYAMYWIKQTTLRSVQKYGHLIRIPINQTSRLLEYNEASVKLANILKCNPTTQELADYMNISVEEVRKCEKMSYTIVSLNKEFGDDQDTTLEEIIPDPVNPFAELENSMMREKLIISLRELLNEKSFLVIALRNGFYNNEPKTLEEIGLIFGVSRERIRQLEVKALRLIKRDTATLSALTKIDYKGTPRKSVKGIFKLLDCFSINDVIKAVNSLDLEDKEAIYERFGKNLNKINEVPYNTLAKIYNEILPKLEKSMGFKTVVEDTLILPSNFKSLLELFPDYSEEQIREGIASLNQNQQQVLKNRYGESLVENRPVTAKDKSNISSNILPRLKAYLKQNFNQNKEYNFQIPEEIKLDMKTKMKLLEILNADYFKPIVEIYGISSAIAIAFAYGHISSQFYDFQTIASLLNTTPEHIKIILNNYLNNIDKINMEGKSLQKKRRE